jgi:uncharacterized protein (TIGR02611 family)
MQLALLVSLVLAVIGQVRGWRYIHGRSRTKFMAERSKNVISTTLVKRVKRVMVFTIGGTVLALGILLIVLPGPAFIVIPAGLAILAVEFEWARRGLSSVKQVLSAAPHQPDSSRRISMKSIFWNVKFRVGRFRDSLRSKR